MILKQAHYNVLGAVCAVLLSTFPAEPARASGFPVIDVAGLGQSIVDFVNQNSQLLEQVAQYQQMLTEYQLMLDNLSGYADIGSLKSVIDDAVNYDFNDTLDDLMALDPESGNFEEQISIIYEDNWMSPPDNNDVNTNYGSVFDNEDMDKIQASYGKDRQRHERYKETYEEIARNRKKADTRKEDIILYSERVASLGPNQEMRALQIQATQMNVMLQQMEASIAAQDQMLSRMEEDEREALEQRLDERKRELDRVKRQTNEIHNDYGIDTWML